MEKNVLENNELRYVFIFILSPFCGRSCDISKLCGMTIVETYIIQNNGLFVELSNYLLAENRVLPPKRFKKATVTR